MQQRLEPIRELLSALPEYQLLFLVGGVLLALAIAVKPVVAKLFPYQLSTARSLRLVLLLVALVVMTFALRSWGMESERTGIDPTQLGL